MSGGPTGVAGVPTPLDPHGARLVDFIVRAPVSNTPGEALHEAKRLLLSALWASASAAAQPDGQDWLQRQAAQALLSPPSPPAPQAPSARPRRRDAAAGAGAGAGAGPDRGAASVWWLGRRSTCAAATDLNQRLGRLQPHAATHLPTGTALCTDLLPALVATAEARGLGGHRLLQAWAIGTEVALAKAAAQRSGSAAQPPVRLGALAAEGRLLSLDDAALAVQLRAAAGSEPAGLAAVARELPAPGRPWRLQSLLLHTRPAAAVALAPIEAALRLRALLPAAMPQALTLHLSPAAWPLADDGDVAHCVAAAWLCGQYTLDEALPRLRQSPPMVALRQRITLCCDPALQGLTQAALSAVDAQGQRQDVRVEQLLGAPNEPLSDAELAELFRQAADDLVLPRRVGEILRAVWSLERMADIGGLTRLLCRPV